VRPRARLHRHRFDIGHDGRQVPEIPPKAVELDRGLLDRKLALDLHAEGAAPSFILAGPVDAERAIDGAIPPQPAVQERGPRRDQAPADASSPGEAEGHEPGADDD